MGRVDLHVHTTGSDGLFSPSEVVKLAKEVGLAGLAITDHDSISGIEEALSAGREWGIHVVPGVEISTLWQGKEIHMLGLHIDYRDPSLLEKLKRQREVRQTRNRMMIEKLNELGIEVTMEEVMAKKKGEGQADNVGRPHIAEVLIDKGIVQSMDEAFDRYLGRDGQAYVTPPRISPIEAIQLIHQSKGKAVIAHPGLYEQDDLIPLLVENGLDGIEVNHPDHTDEAKQRYAEMAKTFGLFETAGSDFHGERHGSMYHAMLGTCTVDESILTKL
ncbi:metal-dependent phosphoesterase [Thermoactinomyces vulgaris]|nr:metal-dependent phosphoesterase [Thermoactinomyces vulgaris]